jgi:phosphoglycerate dehydrogenase-like enzyme
MAEGATLRRDIARANPEELQERIEARTAVIGIVGRGYVGLPLAAALGEAGLRCLGVDLDQEICRNTGRRHPLKAAHVAWRIERGL